MSIATVITGGYGSFAGVNYVPVFGYLPDSSPPTPTPSEGAPGGGSSGGRTSTKGVWQDEKRVTPTPTPEGKIKKHFGGPISASAQGGGGSFTLDNQEAEPSIETANDAAVPEPEVLPALIAGPMQSELALQQKIEEAKVLEDKRDMEAVMFLFSELL